MDTGLSPEKYFPDLYLQDLENWILHSYFPQNINYLKQRPYFGIGSICDQPHKHSVFESGAYKNFISFAHFICVTYEMNVLNFALYAKSQLIFDVWKEECAPFLQTHGYEHTRDLRIRSDELIRYFWFGVPTRLDRFLSVKYYPLQSEFIPTPELLKEYDDFFVPSYAEKVLSRSFPLDSKYLIKKFSPELSEVACNSYGEALLQSILRDPDCSMFRARNLERLKLSKLEKSELEELAKEGISDPLSEMLERKSKIVHCVECRKVFTITRKGQRCCSKKCNKAYYRDVFKEELLAEIARLEKLPDEQSGQN